MLFKWKQHEYKDCVFKNWHIFKWSHTCLLFFASHSLLYFALCNSTPVQVLRAQVRLLPLPVPVWRSSARLRSSSATVEAPAIITATRTASGWPLWMWMKCSGNISFQTMTTVLLGNVPWKTVQTVLNLKDVYHQSIFLIIFFLSAQTESRSQRHWKLETCRPVWAAVLCVWRGRNVVTFLQSVVEDQPSLTTTAAIMLITSEVSLVQYLHI